jgi:hypothetical protein
MYRKLYDNLYHIALPIGIAAGIASLLGHAEAARGLLLASALIGGTRAISELVIMHKRSS